MVVLLELDLPSNEQCDTLSTEKQTIEQGRYIWKCADDGEKEDKTHDGANGDGPYYRFGDLDGGVVDLFAHACDWRNGLCGQAQERGTIETYSCRWRHRYMLFVEDIKDGFLTGIRDYFTRL